LFTSIAERHRDTYASCVHDKTTDAVEWCLRAHMIVDFLSGMTDQFALTSYQRLSGIRL
jgi:dGTPase